MCPMLYILVFITFTSGDHFVSFRCTFLSLFILHILHQKRGISPTNVVSVDALMRCIAATGTTR